MRSMSAMGEQHVGEAAGRGPDVEPDSALRRETKMRETMGELQAAAGDPGVILALQRDPRILGQKLAGFLDAAGLGESLSRHDDGLRAGEAFGQPAIQQQAIGAPSARSVSR
jgi:hypothetical protein